MKLKMIDKKIKKNVFVIPSWYPVANDNISGIFIKEQVEAISLFEPNVNQYVSTWGHSLGHLSLRLPKKIFNSLIWRIKNTVSNTHKIRDNIVEIFNPSLSWSNQLPFGGYKTMLSSNRKNLLEAIRLSKNNIHIIHAHCVYPGGVIANILSNEFNIPYFITEHMGPRIPSLLNNGKPIDIIIKAYRNADKVIAVSPYLKEKLLEYDLKKVTVIPNLVNEKKFLLSKKNNRKFIFFSLGIMTKVKGIDVLLKAIKRCNLSSENTEFWIGGDGPMLSEYKLLAKKLKIVHIVKWLGKIHHNDVPKYFKNCNAFILPSRFETFGVVCAEAIASGKPVIATRCGGPQSIINKSNGILVDVDDIQQLSNAINNLKFNYTEFRGEKLREEFLRKFSRKVVVNQIINLYKKHI